LKNYDKFKLVIKLKKYSDLSSRQNEILIFIKKYTAKNSYPPSIREICNSIKLESTTSVVYHLKKLEKLGKITRSNNKNRAIELTDAVDYSTIALPVVGTIAAGQPILAEENLSDHIVVSENFFYGTNLFILKVKGDSMINVGIYDGDYVVISKQSVANNGEICACLIDDEATVKRLYKENGYFRLQPENDELRPIFTDKVEVLGKVVGLIRNKI
jgi:repressor LexA